MGCSHEILQFSVAVYKERPYMRKWEGKWMCEKAPKRSRPTFRNKFYLLFSGAVISFKLDGKDSNLK